MTELSTPPQIVSGESARRTASLLDYGNIAAVLIPVLIPFWFGASMLVYAMNRHHPNPKVGHYTQWAAYRFYGVTGFVVAAGMFIPTDNLLYYLIIWALAILIIVPWSILDLRRIRQDVWTDAVVEKHSHH